MHKILRATHKEVNINILKARDYYFQQARLANNIFRKYFTLALPGIVSVAGMVAFSVWTYISPGTAPSDDVLDVIVGIVAVLAFIADCFLQTYIDKKLSISNALRELYDRRVFELDENPFVAVEDIETYLEKARYVPDSAKYETWYREMFSEDDFSNKICFMMDNTIYGHRVYEATEKRKFYTIIYVAAVFLLYVVMYAVIPNDSVIAMISPVVLFVAIFDEIKELIGSYLISKEMAADMEQLSDFVLRSHDRFAGMTKEEKNIILRDLQDTVWYNRSRALFISGKIRKQFLDNNCIFYRDLDEVKCMYWGSEVSRPMTASDFEIFESKKNETDDYNLSDEGDAKLITMQDVHDELREMLTDVKRVLDQYDIQFMLDGGTLIGAKRYEPNGSFLPWDDDIDISLNAKDVKAAREAIEKELGDKYVVQSYDDPYYSPRLSQFRVRQKDDVSFIEEKDSELYEKYKCRGLFLDVYAYSPMLVSKTVDYWYRKIMIHPIHKRIKKIESKWKYSERWNDLYLQLFHIVKKCYVKRVDWYKAHAKCDDCYVYEPNYLENINVPGPYIPKSDLYDEGDRSSNTLTFEGGTYSVPANVDNLLRAFYGSNWKKSPLISIEELMEPAGENGDSAYPFTGILYSRPVDYLYKLICVMPLVTKKERLEYKAKTRNEYDKYQSSIDKIKERISKKNEAYMKQIRKIQSKYYGYPPEKIKRSVLGVYYKKTEIVESEILKGRHEGYDLHMYSKDSFDASAYKHVKRVTIYK